MTVAATEHERVAMIEAGANEVADEDHAGTASWRASRQAKKMVLFIKDVQAQIGKAKFSATPPSEAEPELFAAITGLRRGRGVEAALDTDDKNVRDEPAWRPSCADVHEHFAEDAPRAGAP